MISIGAIRAKTWCLVIQRFSRTAVPHGYICPEGADIGSRIHSRRTGDRHGALERKYEQAVISLAEQPNQGYNHGGSGGAKADNAPGARIGREALNLNARRHCKSRSSQEKNPQRAQQGEPKECQPLRISGIDHRYRTPITIFISFGRDEQRDRAVWKRRVCITEYQCCDLREEVLTA